MYMHVDLPGEYSGLLLLFQIVVVQVDLVKIFKQHRKYCYEPWCTMQMSLMLKVVQTGNELKVEWLKLKKALI